MTEKYLAQPQKQEHLIQFNPQGKTKMKRLRGIVPFIKRKKPSSISIDSIDDQHKRIIDLIDELHGSLRKGTDRHILDEILVRLSVYTVQHFIYEENLFKKYGYEFGKEHKREHDELAEFVTEFHKKHSVQNGNIAEDSLELFRKQLFDHFAECDQKYVSFLSSRGVQ